MAKKQEQDPLRHAKMTPAATRAAKRLYAIWQNKARKDRPRQQDMANAYVELYGRGSQGSIGQYLRGVIPLNYRAVKFFAEQFGVQPEEIYPELPEVASAKALQVAEPQPKYADSVSIRRFDTRASMGYGQPQVDNPESIVGTVMVSKEWLRSELRSVSKAENLAILTGYGDSMEGTFSDGSQLIVDRGVHDVKVDSVYVLSLKDNLYVKRLQRRPDGSILMISDNRKYDPYLIEGAQLEQFKVLGRVVGVWNFTKI